MSKYIQEAFKQYALLESDDFDLSPEGLDTLGSYVNQAVEDEGIDVVDLEAQAEDEIKQSYIGKVICECKVCHSNLFYNKEDIYFNDEGVANIDDECPYCMSMEGYNVIGEIKPYTGDEDEPVDEDEDEIDDMPEIDEPEDDLDESVDRTGTDKLRGSKKLSGVKALNGRKSLLSDKVDKQHKIDNDLHESVDSEDDEDETDTLSEGVQETTIKTDSDTITVTPSEDGGVTVQTSPTDTVDDFDFDVHDGVEPGDEVLAPLDDETKDEIDMPDEEPEDADFDFDTDEDEDEDETDINPEEFDEEAFDELGESFLRKNYNNVQSYKTTKVTCNEDLINVEGTISFRSGNSKKTNFIFKPSQVKNGKYIFEGYNAQIHKKARKPFKLTCNFKNNVVISESLVYNYNVRNALNESMRVSGTIKVHGKKRR